jgi:hypothetical protein
MKDMGFSPQLERCLPVSSLLGILIAGVVHESRMAFSRWVNAHLRAFSHPARQFQWAAAALPEAFAGSQEVGLPAEGAEKGLCCH